MNKMLIDKLKLFPPNDTIVKPALNKLDVKY